MINKALFYRFTSQLSGPAAQKYFDMHRRYGKQTQNGKGGLKGQTEGFSNVCFNC